MLFKNDERTNERVLYKTKPSMIFGCKKAIYGVVLLAIAFIVSPKVIEFVGDLQVYLISRIQLPLTRYTAIAFFVVILIIILYIIWQIIKWFSVEYTLTDTRIIIKSGILSTKKNYMPYTTIQDINTSQSIIAKLFNIGTVSAFSAYDNNQIKLEYIPNPSEAEDIIFSNMMGVRSVQQPPRGYVNRPYNDRGYSEGLGNDNYFEDDYYDDEYAPITPIGHEKNNYPRREYEYYPEEFSFQKEDNYNKYEYEPYGDELDYNLNRAMDDSNNQIRYEGHSDGYSDNSYYEEVRDNYFRGGNDYYQDGEEEFYDDGRAEKSYQNKQNQADEVEDSPETVIRRHFDKFKK